MQWDEMSPAEIHSILYYKGGKCMKRKVVSVLMCVALVGTMLMGCGSSGSEDTSSDSAEETTA